MRNVTTLVLSLVVAVMRTLTFANTLSVHILSKSMMWSCVFISLCTNTPCSSMYCVISLISYTLWEKCKSNKVDKVSNKSRWMPPSEIVCSGPRIVQCGQWDLVLRSCLPTTRLVNSFFISLHDIHLSCLTSQLILLTYTMKSLHPPTQMQFGNTLISFTHANLPMLWSAPHIYTC